MFLYKTKVIVTKTHNVKEHESNKTGRDTVLIFLITKANSKSLKTRKARSDLLQVKMSTK